MATAKELLLAYMDLIRKPEEAISLFAADAAIEIYTWLKWVFREDSRVMRRF
jgi:hypothetical protein